MLKHVTSWKISNKLSTKQRILVKSFPGAKTAHMEHLVKPTMNEESPKHLILHVGTNDLNLNKTPRDIANSIIDTAVKTVKNSRTTLSISGIVTRDDTLKHQVRQVNNFLRNLCAERNIGFLCHDNIQSNHLNGSRLHLNKQGTKNMIRNFAVHIEKLH